MLGRMASRVLTSLALLCATFAWAGWVYLRTIGDPARSEKIATAVLTRIERAAQRLCQCTAEQRMVVDDNDASCHDDMSPRDGRRPSFVLADRPCLHHRLSGGNLSTYQHGSM